MASLFAWHNPLGRSMVLPLPHELSGFSRDDGRARGECQSCHALSLGAGLCSGVRQTHSSTFEAHQWFMANRRNVHRSQRTVEISVSSRRFTRQHQRLLVECARGMLLLQSGSSVRLWRLPTAKRHGSSMSISMRLIPQPLLSSKRMSNYHKQPNCDKWSIWTMWWSRTTDLSSV